MATLTSKPKTLARLAEALNEFNQSIDGQHHARQWFSETLLLSTIDILMDAHRKGETTNSDVEAAKGWIYISVVVPVQIWGGGENLWWQEVRDTLADLG